MKALVYQLQLQSPVLLSMPGAGEENSDRSYPFITGSAIRGALANRYVGEHDEKDFNKLFISGQVRFLNAYPLYEDKRTLPAPLSWHVAKDEKDLPTAQAFDFVSDIPDKNILQNPKTLGNVFVAPLPGEVITIATPMQVTVHNVSYKRGVKAKNDSSLFQYEAIAPGYLFAGVILGKEDDLEMMQKLLTQKPQLWLGGSRNAGYGRTTVLKTDIVDDWQEAYGLQYQPEDKLLTITLLSDTIVRDANGNYSVHPEDLLGIPPKAVYMRARVVGGFNRTWGLPIVQALAFQAGSVFVYDANVVTQSKLDDLQENGLGERRAEGFGRIAINWLPRPQFCRKKAQLQIPSASASVTLEEESRKLVQQMAKRHYQTLLDRHLTALVSRLCIGKGVKNSQLNKLRGVLRRVQQENNWQPLIKHLENLNREADKQIKRARIDGDRLHKWLGRANNHGLWEKYFAQIMPPAIAGIQSQADDNLKLAYVVRLMDALLQKASKEKGDESCKHNG